MKKADGIRAARTGRMHYPANLVKEVLDYLHRACYLLSFPQAKRVGNPSSERFRTSRNDIVLNYRSLTVLQQGRSFLDIVL